VLARALAQVTGARLGELAEGGNAAGAYLAGVVPHRGIGGVVRATPGRNARQMFEQTLPGYLLLNTEPWADAVSSGVLSVLSASEAVVAITPYASEQMRRVARVMLPAGTFAETSGTYVSLEARWQTHAGAARPLGDCRPGWKILRVLGNQLDLPQFEYQTSEQVRDELAARIKAVGAAAVSGTAAGGALARVEGQAEPVLDLPMYQIDAIVRRAYALQRTRDGRASLQRYGSGA